MNKKFLTIILICICFCLVFTSCSRDIVCGKNSVSYLSLKGSKTYLNNYDIDSNKEQKGKIGLKDEVFWGLFDIYDGGNIVVLNTGEIMVLDSSGSRKYSDISNRIVAIKKIEENILIISQQDEEMEIKIFNESFSEQLYSEKIPGDFSNIIKSDDKIILTSYNEKLQDSYLHIMEYKESFHLVSHNLFNYAATIVPINVENQIFVFVNKTMDSSINWKDVNVLYSVNDDFSINTVHTFDNGLSYGWGSKEEIFLLMGENSTSLYSYSLSSSEIKTLYSLENEAICHAYSLSNRIFLISDKGLYLFENNTIEKVHGWNTMLPNDYN